MLGVDVAGDLEQVVVGLVIALLVAVATGLWRLFRRLDRQDEEQRAQRRVLIDLKADLDRQFGGNSGGLREAVNALQLGQKAITDRFDRHLEQHAQN